MDIQVGDRVTYKYKEEVFERLVTCEKDLNEFRYGEEIEILKIERPKYEVVKEKKDKIKKELLTEEEKQFLKQIFKFAGYGNEKHGIVKYIKQEGYWLNFHFSPFHCNGIYIDKENYFLNLTKGEEYTLSELGLED